MVLFVAIFQLYYYENVPTAIKTNIHTYGNSIYWGFYRYGGTYGYYWVFNVGMYMTLIGLIFGLVGALLIKLPKN